MSAHVERFVNAKSENPVVLKVGQGIGAVLLFFVAYIHLALFFNMMSFRLLPILFLLNALGALVALIGVLLNNRWIGWVLGIVMSGGAAVARIAMNTVPGVSGLLMGRPGGGRFRPGFGGRTGGGRGGQFGGAPGAGGGRGGSVGSNAGSHAGQFGGAPGAGHFGQFPGGPAQHGILPTFMNTGTLGTVAIVIELAFVVLAIGMLVAIHRRRSQGPV